MEFAATAATAGELLELAVPPPADAFPVLVVPELPPPPPQAPSAIVATIQIVVA
jgi:hypothetical protein